MGAPAADVYRCDGSYRLETPSSDRAAARAPELLSILLSFFYSYARHSNDCTTSRQDSNLLWQTDNLLETIIHRKYGKFFERFFPFFYQYKYNNPILCTPFCIVKL